MVAAGVTGEATRLVRGLRWVSLGRSERAAWGRCQGSAATPYETVVAADRPSTTSCSCPSRNRPCKHAIGLADLAADGQIAVAEEPGWVARIVARRPFASAGPEETGSARPSDGPVDPEAAVRRAEARRTKVALGLAELQLLAGGPAAHGAGRAPVGGLRPLRRHRRPDGRRTGPGCGGQSASPARRPRLGRLAGPGAARPRWSAPAGRGAPAAGRAARGARGDRTLPGRLSGEQGQRPGSAGRARSLVGNRGHRHGGVPVDHPPGLAAWTRHGSLGHVADRGTAGSRPRPDDPTPAVRTRAWRSSCPDRASTER